MSQEDGDKPVDNVDVAAAWQALELRTGSQLIDVRTRAEWTYVGIPDLESLGKRAVLVEWQTFPDQTIDPRFVDRLAGELSALGVKLDDDLFFICRSGGRSLAAAKAMAAVGYRDVTTSRAALKDRSTTRDIGAPPEVGRRLDFPGCKARCGWPRLKKP